MVVTCFLLPAIAQEDGWSVDEQCASRASADNWSYNGTILATGYGGLHGINAAWETPRVVARIGRYPDGRLSPDNRWYAGLERQVIYAESFNHLHVIEAIHVYSTLDNTIVYSVPWENSWLQMWGYRAMYWLNNEHILYEYSEDYVHDLDELVMLNPFDNTTSQWNSAIDILDGGSGFQREYIQFPSPDFTRTVYYHYDTDESRHYHALYDVSSGELLTELQLSNDAVVVWFPDSSTFVAESSVSNDDTRLALYDRDGNFMTTLFDLGLFRIRHPQNMSLSPDSRYLAFKPDYQWERQTLHIVDMESGTVIDTCLIPADSFVWSPNGTQITFLEPGNGTQNVYIFDLSSWSYRAVGRHIVQTSFWDMVIGWREN